MLGSNYIDKMVKIHSNNQFGKQLSPYSEEKDHFYFCLTITIKIYHLKYNILLNNHLNIPENDKNPF